LRRYKKKTIAHYVPEHRSDEEICIYSFETIDIVTDVAVRLGPAFNGFSELYKYQQQYFLLLQNDTSNDSITTDKIELILGEYGQKHVSTVLAKYHLIEHGEMLMKNPAVKTLKNIFQ